MAARLANRVLTSDGHKAYLETVDGVFGSDIDYAEHVRVYLEGSLAAAPARSIMRAIYSPGERCYPSISGESQSFLALMVLRVKGG